MFYLVLLTLSSSQAVQEHLKNPAIMEKIMKLKDAGLISMSYR